jgi:hypothetical protein
MNQKQLYSQHRNDLIKCKEIQRIEVNYDILTFEGDTDKYNVRNICFSNDSKSIAS